MPDSKQAEFKQRLVAVVADLNRNGVDDGETMYMIGRVADGLCQRSGQASWRGLKSNLTRSDYDRLLAGFQQDGNKADAAGQGKLVYALQALMTSLVAKTQTDPEIVAGTALLDTILDAALANYRRQMESTTR